MGTTHFPDGGTWKPPKSLWITKDGAWSWVKELYAAHAGAWHRIYPPDGSLLIGRAEVGDGADWVSVAYNSGLGMLAMVHTYAPVAGPMTSVSGARDWIKRPTPGAWTDVVAGNGRFVAVKMDTSTDDPADGAMTSTDGVTWTLRTGAGPNRWMSVTYGAGLFVAVANMGVHANTDPVMTSPDGVTWTRRPVPGGTVQRWAAVHFGGGQFVALADPNFAGPANSRVMTSPDGINWTQRSMPTSTTWRGLTYGNGTWVAVGAKKVATSPDGITWQEHPIPVSPTGREATSVMKVAYGPRASGAGVFVAVRHEDAETLLTSPDGINWTWHPTPGLARTNWRDICYVGNGLFVVSGIGEVMTVLVP